MGLCNVPTVVVVLAPAAVVVAPASVVVPPAAAVVVGAAVVVVVGARVVWIFNLFKIDKININSFTLFYKYLSTDLLV